MGKARQVTIRYDDRRRRWVVRWRIFSPTAEIRRPKKFLDTEEHAKVFRDKKASELLEKGERNSLSPSDETDARAAKAILGENVSLREAARFYLRHHPRNASVTVAKAIEAYRQSRQPLPLAQQRQVHADSAIKAFPRFSVGHYQNRVLPVMNRLTAMYRDTLLAALTPEDLTEFLRTHYTTPVTYNDATRVLKVFFEWCMHKHRQYVQTNPASSIDTLEEPWLIPEIYTPDEVRRVLAVAQQHDADLIPFLALGFFGGLRVCEIRKLQASDIDLASKVINVRAEVAKSSGANQPQPRVIEGLPGNVWAWLLLSGGASVSIDCINYHRRRRKIFQLADVAFKDNAARHSFATYAYAFCRGDDLPRKWTGHRIPTAFFKHYAAVVTHR